MEYRKVRMNQACDEGNNIFIDGKVYVLEDNKLQVCYQCHKIYWNQTNLWHLAYQKNFGPDRPPSIYHTSDITSPAKRLPNLPQKGILYIHTQASHIWHPHRQ